jgi:2-methylisocitrate lyase-like PEP mutase family enzyme
MNMKKRWRELLKQPGLILIPGAYDALSARIIEAQGFDAIVAGGYAAVGSLLAQPDGGQSNMRDFAEHYGRIVDAVNVPVYVDADTGFGGVHNVRQAVRAFEKVGVAGMFIGDQVFPNRCGYLPGKEIVPVDDILSKLAAAVDAKSDPDFFIAARTDAYAIDGLNAAIDRANMFLETGVDMAMAQGADTLEEVERVLKEIPGPHLANQSHAAGKAKTTLDELEAMGYNGVVFPSAALFAAVGGVTRAMQAIKQDRSFEKVSDELCSLDEYYDIVQLQGHNSLERKYVQAAEGIINKNTKVPI